MIVVRDVRWTTDAELCLPAWKKTKNWKSGYELVWLGKVTENQFGIVSNINQLHEIQNKQKSKLGRFCLYLTFDAQENDKTLFELAAETFGFNVPLLPNNSKPVGICEQINKPGLALTLDILPENEIRGRTTIVIPHWESLGFLRLCIESIKDTFQQEPMPEILVIDDYSRAEVWEELEHLSRILDFKCLQVKRHDHAKVADVGALLDLAIAQVSTEFICMLDADTIVLSIDFLSLPIKHLQDRNIISVGLDTNLGDSYHGNLHWGNFFDPKVRIYGLPGSFSVTNNLFRVMRTLDAQAISLAEPFSRRVKDRKTRDQIGRLIRRLDSKLLGDTKFSGVSRELIKARLLNSNWPSMPPTSDNGVNANFWMDANNIGRKINIPITSYGLLTPNDGVCIQNISSLLIHVALSTRALSDSRREIEDAGRDFYSTVEEIKKNNFNSKNLMNKLEKMSQKYPYLP